MTHELRLLAWTGSGGALLVTALAIAGTPSKAATASSDAHDPATAITIARGHGVAHDSRARASIERWMAIGQPLGTPMAPSQAVPDVPAPASAPVDRTVTIRTAGSNLSFEPDALSLKRGTRVRIQYINEGVLPHNFVVLFSEDDLDALGAAAYDAEATGFVPLAEKEKLIAYTELAPPGATVSVTFVVPEPGEYTFVCLFPGHYNVMLGTLKALA